jgi:hypothetical protein
MKLNRLKEASSQESLFRSISVMIITSCRRQSPLSQSVDDIDSGSWPWIVIIIIVIFGVRDYKHC